MEQIIFFTNPGKLEVINIKTKFQDGTIEIKAIPESSKKRIFIIDENANVNILKILYNNESFFVYHNGTLKIKEYKEILDKEKYKFEDHHINGYTKIYHEIENILSGFNDSKFEQLKNIIIDVKLDVALEYLHECLNGTAEKRKLSAAGFDLNSVCSIGKGTGKKIDQLISEYSESSENIDSLEALRDGILEMAGVK